jgi:D-alanyl-D-alanine carboxypeptidase/D-alanyl-D-alanine-endopeptidase (penicillin-binding protein 4)
LIARDLNDDSFATAVSTFAATLDATSCVVVQLDGVEVGSHNPDLAVIPASNQKLLVAAAALDVLGPEHVFTTEARAAGIDGGVVAGDLYLVGGGDPLLTTDDYPAEQINGYPVLNATSLDRLADAIAAAGVTRIDGNVVGDGSRYDDELFHPNWPDDLFVTEAGPLDALLVNDARFLTDDWQVANDPSAGAAEELGRLLEARGIAIGGEATTGSAPQDAPVVASIDSAPLPAVIAEMQASSDNNTAELLLKEIGVATGGGGTTAAGAAGVVASLAAMGLDTTGVVVDDGSGLSNGNRVTCRLLASVLGRHRPGDQFANGLPLAGQEGTTLSDVFVGSAVEDRLIGKTGTLHNEPYNADPPAVKALSGYLPVDGGGTIEYSLVLNSTGTLTEQTVYRPIWDAFAGVLAAYPAGPSAAELGPG